MSDIADKCIRIACMLVFIGKSSVLFAEEVSPTGTFLNQGTVKSLLGTPELEPLLKAAQANRPSKRVGMPINAVPGQALKEAERLFEDRRQGLLASVQYEQERPLSPQQSRFQWSILNDSEDKRRPRFLRDQYSEQGRRRALALVKTAQDRLKQDGTARFSIVEMSAFLFSDEAGGVLPRDTEMTARLQALEYVSSPEFGLNLDGRVAFAAARSLLSSKLKKVDIVPQLAAHWGARKQFMNPDAVSPDVAHYLALKAGDNAVAPREMGIAQVWEEALAKDSPVRAELRTYRGVKSEVSTGKLWYVGATVPVVAAGVYLGARLRRGRKACEIPFAWFADSPEGRALRTYRARFTDPEAAEEKDELEF